MTTIKRHISSIFPINPPANLEEIESVKKSLEMNKSIGTSEAQLILSNFSQCEDSSCNHNHSHPLEKPLEEFLNKLSPEEKQACLENIFIQLNRGELTEQSIERLLKTAQNKSQAPKECTPQQWKEIHAGQYACIRPECRGACGKPYSANSEEIKKPPFNMQKHWPKFATGFGLALAGVLAYLASSPNSQSDAIKATTDLTNLFSSLLNSLPSDTKAPSFPSHKLNTSLTSLQLTNFANFQTD